MNTYHVFISHSSQDKEKAKGLAIDLKGQEYAAWFDTDKIEASDDWIKEIEDGVDNSSVMVVIWTKNAAESRWVNREMARADGKNMPIIPLVFDDTPISSILLQRIQYIDFRKGYFLAFQELVSHLTRLLDSDAKALASATSYIWQPAKQPFYRSRFLEENNYLDRKSENFALNQRTNLLVNYDKQTLEPFVSIVAIPTPNAIDIDLIQLNSLPEFGSHPQRFKYSEDQEPWQYFSLSSLRSTHKTQSDIIFYSPHPQSDRSNSPIPIGYVRFNEDGGIEFVSSSEVVYFSTEKRFEGYVFNLIRILGFTWKLICLATNLYEKFSYDGSIQLIVNLRKVENATLAGFGKSDTGHEWSSLVSNGLYSFRGLGIATDTNLQFIYNINLKALRQNPKISEDLIVHLSQNLQRSFNWKIENRHYPPNMNQFPWRQFYNYIDIEV